MKRIFSLFLLLIGFQFSVLAQDNSTCPIFSIEEPTNFPKPGDKVNFKVIFRDNYDTSNLKFNWTVPTGKLISGQGTELIVVEPQMGDAATVTVEISGLSANCNNKASVSAYWCALPVAVKTDEYTKIFPKDELQKLIGFDKQLQNDPTTQAIIIKTFPRNFSEANISKNLKQTLKLFKSLHVDESRYSFGIIYADQEKTNLYIVPTGATLPSAEKILSVEKLEEKLKKSKKNERIKKL